MSVYFAERDGLIKIGWSQNVRYRITSLKASLIGTVSGGRAEERALHVRFAHLRVCGEWFKDVEELRGYIRDEAQDHEPDLDIVKVNLRLPNELLNRIDAVAIRMCRPGFNVTRADVLRMATFRGVEQLEAELKMKKARR